MITADDRGEMVITITLEGPNGQATYTGHVVSRTDHTITMLLTDPYERSGQSVLLEVDLVVREDVVAR